MKRIFAPFHPCAFSSSYPQKEPQKNTSINRSLPFSLHGYLFTAFLGSGSCSIVLKAVHISTNNPYAAKILTLQNEENKEMMWQISQSEVESLKRLNHPNIIKLYDFFFDSDHLFIILQLCDGGTLRQLIRPHVGIAPKSVLIPMMYDILQAIAFCHDMSIAHRDIKPTNIFIDSFGRPLIADFGLSSVRCRYDEYGENDRANICVGSFLYFSPEELNRIPDRSVTKSDIWSLGVTFYLMATGNDPWPKVVPELTNEAIVKGIFNIPNRVGRKVKELISKMLVVDPTERLSAAELLKLPLFNRKPHIRAYPVDDQQLRRAFKSEESKKLKMPLCFMTNHPTAPAEKIPIFLAGSSIMKGPNEGARKILRRGSLVGCHGFS